MYDRNKTCCFSGHRPEKLLGGADIHSEDTRRLLSMLKLVINQAVEQGYRYFITGMARGVDLWAAQMVVEIKQYNPEIKLICAMPYKLHGSTFRGIDKWDFGTIREAADEVIYVNDSYTKNCMLMRNRFMADNSSKLIAVVSNYRSGTGQTIRYAKSIGLDVHTIDINENAPYFTKIQSKL